MLVKYSVRQFELILTLLCKFRIPDVDIALNMTSASISNKEIGNQ
jgi:hypothetical protein